MKIAAISTYVFHPNWRTLCDNRHWLPHIFTGKFVSAAFWFNQQDKLSSHRLVTTNLLSQETAITKI